MNISNNFKKFREFITPPVFAARATYPGYRGRLAKIVTLSLFASLLEAGALGVLFVLLQVFTDKTVEEYVRWAFLRPYSESLVALSLVCATLLFLSIRCRFLARCETIGVSIESSRLASQLALNHVHASLRGGTLSIPPDKSRRALIKPLVKTIPPSVGFVSKSLCSILMNVIQGLIFFGILFYLSPLTSMAVAMLGLILLVAVSNPFENFLGYSEERDQNAGLFQEESQRLADAMLDTSQEAGQFNGLVHRTLSSGGIERNMQIRGAMRTERSTGSLVVEYAFPLAIIGIALVYTYSVEWAPDITEVALYFLLIRLALGALTGIGSTFMAMSRHYAQALAFRRLLEENILPGRFSEASDEE